MKVLLIATVQSHICQFHKPLVQMLHDHGCEVHVAAHDNLAVKNGLKLDFVERVFDIPFERSPFSLKNVVACREVKKIIEDGHYDVVHCNTPVGGIVGRLAARKARKKGTKVYYTAHGFHFYKGASKKNWLIYYPIEKFMSRMADLLITITVEDEKLAKKKFHCQVAHIHGVGVSPERYHLITDEEKQKKKDKMGYGNVGCLILCTGELNANKDQATIIRAMPEIVKKIPSVKLLLAGNGPKEAELKRLGKSLMMQEYIEFLGYRTDLERFTCIVDLVVSCSHREGLPLNIVEAMLCKKPVVASHNRGHDELVKDGKTGYLVDAGDSSAYSEKVIELLQNKEGNREFGIAGAEYAKQYTSSAVYKELNLVYGLQADERCLPY